jgi:hypothetical protein
MAAAQKPKDRTEARLQPKASLGQRFKTARDWMNQALLRVPKLSSLSSIQKKELRRQINAAKRYLSKKASGSLEMAGRLKHTITLLDGLSATRKVFESNIKNLSGTQKNKTIIAYKLWKIRSRMAADSLLRKKAGALHAANMLVNMGMFVAGASAEAQDIRRNLIPALKKIPISAQNKKICDQAKLKDAPQHLAAAAKAIVDYWKKPNNSRFKSAAKLLAQYSKTDMAVQYSRAEVELQQNYRALIKSGNKAIKWIDKRMALVSKLARQGRLNPYDARNMRKQLSLVKKDIKWRLRSLNERLKKHKITDAAQQNGGLLVRNPNYFHDLSAMAKIFARIPQFADIISWRALLSQRVHQYLGAKGKKKIELGKSLRKLIRDCRSILNAEIKGLPKFVSDPKGVEKKKIGRGTLNSMRAVKGYVKAALNNLEQVLFKGKLGDPIRAMKNISQESMMAAKAIAKHIGSEIERHFDKRSWYQKYKMVIWDAAVIALALAASIPSGGLSAAILLGAEAAYFGTRTATNIVASYAETGKTPGFFEILGHGALTVIPAARLGRFVIASRIASRGALSAEFGFSLRSSSVIARRAGVEMAAATSRSARALGKIASISGVYLMGSATVHLAMNPTMEAFLTNLVFFAGGYAGAKVGKMGARTVAEYAGTRMNEVHAALMSAAERSALRRYKVRRAIKIAAGTLKGAGKGVRTAVRATTLRITIADIINDAITGGVAGYKKAKADATAGRLWSRYIEAQSLRDAATLGKDAKTLFVAFLRYRDKGGKLNYADFSLILKPGKSHQSKDQVKKAKEALKWSEKELAPKPVVPKKAPAPKTPVVNEAVVKAKLAKAAADLGFTIEGMFRDLEPGKIRSHLTKHGLDKAEINFALGKYANEIIQGYESRIKGKKDASLKSEIEQNGANGALNWLLREGYTSEIAKVLINKHYRIEVANYKVIQSVLFRLFSPLDQSIRDTVSLSDSVLRVLRRNEAMAREFNRTIPEIVDALQRLAGRPLRDIEATSSTYEGSNVLNIDIKGGARALYFVENGRIYVTDIFPSGQKKQYLKKVNRLKRKTQKSENYRIRSIGQILMDNRNQIISEASASE